MGFFWRKRTEDGWNVSSGNGWRHVDKETEDGWYDGWTYRRRTIYQKRRTKFTPGVIAVFAVLWMFLATWGIDALHGIRDARLEKEAAAQAAREDALQEQLEARAPLPDSDEWQSWTMLVDLSQESASSL